MGNLRISRGTGNYHRRPFTSGANPPIAPSGHSASQTAATTVTAVWTDNSPNETGFYVYESIDAGAYALANTTAANATSWANTSVVIGSTYTYKIAAFNAAGASANTTATNTVTPSYLETNSDANVALLFYFDEASGSIVDEIASVTLGSNGTPTFSQTSSGGFSGISPGIKYTAAGDGHLKNSATSQADLGTSDFTFEWYYKQNSGATGTNLYFFQTFEPTPNGYECWMNTNGGVTLSIYIETTDGLTGQQFDFTVGTLDNGNIHKLRLVGTRAGNLQLFLDGVSKGTISLASFVGKGITGGVLALGNTRSLNQTCKGTMYTFRLANNATANLGGPGGG